MSPTKLLDKQIDRLYGLSLDEFTAARNELAQGLRASGDGEAAQQVKALRKPTIAAWAVNQLARRRRRDLRALLRAADALREAHSGGDAERLRSAASVERDAIRTLADAARELLDEGGRKPTDATVERVSATLRGAAADAETRPLLQAGRLAEDVDPTTGFAGLAPAVAPAKRDDATRRRRNEARERVRRLRDEVRELRRAAQRAEREADQARKVADAATAKLERAERTLTQAEERV